MILQTTEFKNACSKILTSIDSSTSSSLMGKLELKTVGEDFYLNVTNREYFVEVKIGKCDEDFHATINAELFLKLISQVTTEEIEFKIVNDNLIVKANGTYKFPLDKEGDDILTLPKIVINNKTSEFDISGDILNGILVNNSRELSKIPKDGRAVKEVQKRYYVDEQGAITFYNGACVNKFDIEKPVKMLLNSNLVKLFSLFKGKAVHCELGYDAISEDVIQTKLRLIADDVVITAILSCDDSMLKQVPAQSIRNRAFGDFPYRAEIGRVALLSAIKRLTLFTEESIVSNYKTCGKCVFTKKSLIISDYTENNSEEIMYDKEITLEGTYEALFDLHDIELVVESDKSSNVTINFGDKVAMVIAKGDNIFTVIPEIAVNN